MAAVADTLESTRLLSVSAAICVDGGAFDRFGRVLRHLAVGLIDQAVPLRLLSDDPRLGPLRLGPVRTLVHDRISWPAARRRIEKVVEALHHDAPTVVHAMSADSYRLALALSDEFDADLLLEVASMSDCDAVQHLPPECHADFMAISLPLVGVLETQLKIPPDRIHLVRPGVLVSRQGTCFSRPDRRAALLCTSPLERHSGVHLLVEALALLQKKGCELMSFLLGRGRLESSLRRLVRQRSLSGAITFAYPLGDVGHAMHSADIFVRPSADTAFAVDVLQAMGAGMAVVTFPNRLFDYLRDGETAVFCGKHSAESIAEAIEGLLVDRTEARQLAARAQDEVRAHHAVSAMAEGTAAVYRQLALARATFSIRE